jgi:hypothetical protein
MDKKDIYEHLAKIYLDASSKKKKRIKTYPRVIRNIFLAVAVFIFGLSFATVANIRKNRPLNSELALVLLTDAAKINFHFDPAKKETYSLDLKNLNLMRYKALGFSVKKASYQNKVSLRVEFTSNFKERSEVYFRDIPSKWQDYKISLSQFKNITDWSEMSKLLFMVEEWNVQDKKGVVYIDNVRLLK